MPNYKICIQYDGSEFYGWQSQPSRNTIQDALTESIFRITTEKVNLIGSGRTDSGVHALGQVANFRFPAHLDIYKFQHSLNSILPTSISIKNIVAVKDEFHSRFDAIKRSYIYLINREKSPFYNRYSYFYPNADKIDFSKLKTLSKVLIGEHDFTSYCKTKTDIENKVCIVNDVAWKTQGSLIVFKIEANRFLHGMVRTVVGTLLSATQQNKSKEYLMEVFEAKNREFAGEAIPAKGLFLNKVKY